MRILGIDPGLAATGYGLIQVEKGQEPRLVEAGIIRTKSSQPLSRRLASVAQELKALLLQHRPAMVAVEDLYSYYKTPKPAILMGHVRGVILSTAASIQIPVESYMPTLIKRAVVGRGHASKDQVARMVRMRLRLKERQVPSDVTDALAAALCYASRIQSVLQRQRPKVAGKKLPPRLWTSDVRRLAGVGVGE